MTKLRGWLSVCAVVAIVACDAGTAPSTNTPADGSEGGSCRGDGSCDDGLRCASRTCVRVPGEGEGEGEGETCDPAIDADCDGTIASEDCDDNDRFSNIRLNDADCDGTRFTDDCDDHDAASATRATDADCDRALTADDCDDRDPSSTTVATDADCDGAIAADDCDDTNPGSTVVAEDADCDGIGRIDGDCDDNDPTSTTREDDADCDGVLTADDCNDGSAASTTLAADADCDGAVTEADCDDDDATLAARATDGDCDGAVTAADCDDGDPTSTTRATDGDCDGVLTAQDCNDASATSTTRATDGDCDGVLTAQDCNDANPAQLSSAPVTFSLENAFARTPANVTLFFRATECTDDPVVGLAANAFTVREDGNSVSVFESGQTLLSTSLGFERFSLLMLDMSGSTIASGALPSLLSAAEGFVDATVVDGGSHRVAIQLFDGRQLPVDVVDYTNDVTALQTALNGLNDYVVVDSSTNLNGAVIAGLADVDAKLQASQAGAKSSALVLFTDGTDQTAYFTTEQAVAAVSGSPSAVFAIGLGAELDATALRRIGKSGAEFAAEQSDIVTAFSAIGAALEREAGGYYILSYCSPKRAGSHVLTVGVAGRPGQASYTFNATGFGAGCTPEGVGDPCANRECGVVDGIVCGACSGAESCTAAGVCQVAPADVCGDGVRTVNEACDDGDTVAGDGCNANCTAIEGGFTCPTQGGACSPICGDGLKRGAEACDDGNTANGDGCSSTCGAIESGFTCNGQGVGSCQPQRCYAMKFDGGTNPSDSVVASFDPFIGRTEFTAEAWVRLNAYSQYGHLFSSTAFTGVFVRGDIGYGAGRNRWGSVSWTSTTSNVGSQGSQTIPLGRWEHVVLQLKAGELSLWINGVKNSSVAGFTSVCDIPEYRAISGVMFSVGDVPRSPDQAGDEGLVGDVDEVRLSSIARYSATFTPPTHFSSDGDTYLLWTFDEDGSVVIDHSGAGHNGALVRTPTRIEMPGCTR